MVSRENRRPQLGFFLTFSLLALASTSSEIAEPVQEQTTGVLNDWGATEGVNLFPLSRGVGTYLIDNKGNQLWNWTEPDAMTIGGNAILSEEGTLLRPVRLPSIYFNFPQIAGGVIREYTAKGDCIWEFRYSSSLYRQYGEFTVFPNGNLLVTSFEVHSYFDAYAKGYRGFSFTFPDGYWGYSLVEVDRKGHENPEYDPEAPYADGNFTNTCQRISDERDLIWKWTLFDHASDEIKFSTWDINLPFSITGVDYLPERDHIVFGCQFCSEVFIIDHGVKASEVPGPKGDFIYRWGNPSNYGKEGEIKLQGAGVGWIQDKRGYKFYYGVGSLLVYNIEDPENPEFSSVIEFTPVYRWGKYLMKHDGTFAPEDINYRIFDVQDKIKVPAEEQLEYGYQQKAYSYEIEWRNFRTTQGGFAQKFPNGNVLLSNLDDDESTTVEVEKLDRNVWEYSNLYYNADGSRDGPKDPDQVLGMFDEVPDCGARLCNRYIWIVRYSWNYKGLYRLFRYIN